MKPLRYALTALPSLTILAALLVGCSLRIGGYPLLPAVFLIPVFYWLIFRPDWVPLWSLFGIGVFYDALLGNWLGSSSLLLILSAFASLQIRPLLSSQNFILIWATYCCYSFCYLLLYGLGDISLLVSWGYGIILYPPLAWALGHLHLRLQAHA